MKFIFPATRTVNRAKAADANCDLLFVAEKHRWPDYSVLLGISAQSIFPEDFGDFLKRNGYKVRRSDPVVLPGTSSPQSYDCIKGRIRLFGAKKQRDATPSFIALIYFSDKSLAHFGAPSNWYGVIGETDLTTHGAVCRWNGKNYEIDFH